MALNDCPTAFMVNDTQRICHRKKARKNDYEKFQLNLMPISKHPPTMRHSQLLVELARMTHAILLPSIEESRSCLPPLASLCPI